MRGPALTATLQDLRHGQFAAQGTLAVPVVPHIYFFSFFVPPSHTWQMWERCAAEGVPTAR